MKVEELIQRLDEAGDAAWDARGVTVEENGWHRARSVTALIRVNPTDDVSHVRLVLASLDDARSPALTIGDLRDRAEIFADEPELEVLAARSVDGELVVEPLEDVIASEEQAAAGGGRPEGDVPAISTPGWDGERRTEARVRTHVPVVCRLPHGRGARIRHQASPAVVKNASTSGLLVEGPTAPAVEPGSRFELTCRGERGEVVVLRVEPAGRPDTSRYAVTLVDPSERLIEALLAGTAYEPRTAIGESWRKG